MEPDDSQFLSAAIVVEGLHVAFDTLITAEGTIPNAARFFSNLKDLPELRQRIEELIEWNRRNLQCREFSEMWEETKLLFNRIAKVGKSTARPSTGRSFRYFYAVSGLSYLWFCERSRAVANRETEYSIEKNRSVLARRSGVRQLEVGSVSDAMKMLARMQRNELRPFWNRV